MLFRPHRRFRFRLRAFSRFLRRALAFLSGRRRGAPAPTTIPHPPNSMVAGQGATAAPRGIPVRGGIRGPCHGRPCVPGSRRRGYAIGLGAPGSAFGVPPMHGKPERRPLPSEPSSRSERVLEKARGDRIQAVRDGREARIWPKDPMSRVTTSLRRHPSEAPPRQPLRRARPSFRRGERSTPCRSGLGSRVGQGRGSFPGANAGRERPAVPDSLRGGEGFLPSQSLARRVGGVTVSPSGFYWAGILRPVLP